MSTRATAIRWLGYVLAMVDLFLVLAGALFLLAVAVFDAPMALLSRQSPLDILGSGPFLAGYAILILTSLAAAGLLSGWAHGWWLQLAAALPWVALTLWVLAGAATFGYLTHEHRGVTVERLPILSPLSHAWIDESVDLVLDRSGLAPREGITLRLTPEAHAIGDRDTAGRYLVQAESEDVARIRMAITMAEVLVAQHEPAAPRELRSAYAYFLAYPRVRWEACYLGWVGRPDAPPASDPLQLVFTDAERSRDIESARSLFGELSRADTRTWKATTRASCQALGIRVVE